MKEDECVHRLVLRCGGNVLSHGKVRKEGFDLGFTGKEFFSAAHSVEANKPDDPAEIGSLGGME